MTPVDSLTESEVPELLRELGIIDQQARPAVRRLAGGVSSAVFSASWGDHEVVLKQALPELQVAMEWRSDPVRSDVEWRAARYLASLLPGNVVRPIAHHGRRHVLAMEAAPHGSHTWKEELLAGTVDVDIAAQVGAMLGTIHECSRGDPILIEEFGDKRFFDELRLDPYLGEVRRRYPALGGIVDGWTTRLTEATDTFVHGDFSPKNLLIAPDRRVLLIDHEVAHLGDPSFDLAFVSTHLIAKSLRFAATRRAFDSAVAAYADSAPVSWRAVKGRAPQLVGLVMLARVDGKSPLEYLDDDERRRLRSIALGMVHDPPPSLDRLSSG